MHRIYKRVCFSNDHCRGHDLLAAEPGELPYACEGKRLEVFTAEAIRLLAIFPLLPLGQRFFRLTHSPSRAQKNGAAEAPLFRNYVVSIFLLRAQRHHVTGGK